MKIKILYNAPIYPDCYVLQTIAGEYKRFYDKPARRIEAADLSPVPYYRPKGAAGEEAPAYIYAMYGLEATREPEE